MEGLWATPGSSAPRPLLCTVSGPLVCFEYCCTRHYVCMRMSVHDNLKKSYIYFVLSWKVNIFTQHNNQSSITRLQWEVCALLLWGAYGTPPTLLGSSPVLEAFLLSSTYCDAVFHHSGSLEGREVGLLSCFSGQDRVPGWRGWGGSGGSKHVSNTFIILVTLSFIT